MKTQTKQKSWEFDIREQIIEKAVETKAKEGL